MLSSMKTKLLSQLIDQFQTRHHRLPNEIIVHPVALTALALKQSIAPTWKGVPVRCREIKPVPNPTGNKMGVTVIEGVLRNFDL